MRLYRRVPGFVLSVASLAAGMLAASGFGLVAIWSVALVAGIVALSRWLSISLALAASVGAFFSIELLLLLVTPMLGAGMTLPHVVLWGSLAVGIGTSLTVRPAPPALNRSGSLLALASSAGAIVLLVCLAIAQFISGGQRLAWAMNGDTVNAMAFARRMLVDGGINQASTPQPTPLPFAMSAANMEGGRGGAASLLLQHDVARTAQVWVFVIVLSCLLVGVILARVAHTAPLRWAVPVVALSTTVMLSWYAVGLQFDFGFMNSAFAVTLLLAAWLVYAAGEARPALLLLTLFTIALALLSVWSPLVVCVAGLGIVTVVRERRALAASRPIAIIGTYLAASVFLAYAALVTVPFFLLSSSALGSNGGFPPVGPGSIFVITALVLIASAGAVQTGAAHTAVGVIAVVTGFGLGLGYLILQRQEAAFHWGYYPAKFAWTTSILLMVILMSVAVHLLQAVEWKPARRAVTTVLVAGLVVSLLWGPVAPASQAPLAGLVKDSSSETVAKIVFDLVGTENGKDFLWRSTIGDYWVNTWLLQIDQPDGDPLKTYATFAMLEPAQVCELVAGLGDGVVIHTSDPAADFDLRAACPAAQFTIVHGEF